MTKKVIGLFEHEIDVIRQIEQLKVEGYSPKSMYAVTKDADFNLLLQHRTAAEVTSAGPNMVEKMKSIFLQEEPIKDYLIEFGLSEEEAAIYHEEIEHEKILLVLEEEAVPQKNFLFFTPKESSKESSNSVKKKDSPLPSKEEAEDRQKKQERDKYEEPTITDDTLIPPNQQPYHRDFF
ncbi:hypothetical protein JOC78_002538 [Bacillus ectoiniformans]|uniref:general stress protein n=1 Tax=Bacillus ectoiniformans TaxID=1494429 RepID=UPI00195749A5|nr:hypothetical protein [Bacillus ectoiniformans]